MPVVVPQPRTQSERTSDNPVRIDHLIFKIYKTLFNSNPTNSSSQQVFNRRAPIFVASKFPVVKLYFTIIFNYKVQV